MRGELRAVAVAALMAVGLAGCGPSNGMCPGGVCPGSDGGASDLSTDDRPRLGDDFGPGIGFDLGAIVGDPATCADAAMFHTYVGCDYWPTVVANAAWSIFDFAVVVSNPGMQPASVTVTGPNATSQTTTVPPNQLVKIYLPWVSALKGPDADECGGAAPIAASVLQAGGAYHLVSDVPVIVYQFNALEYKGMGGPAGKSWATCPGTTTKCKPPLGINQPIGCFSFSNDASLLLPSTAMTQNYRVASIHGVSGPLGLAGMPSYIAVTGTQDATMVSMKLSSTARVVAGGVITAANAGQTITFNLNAGDVAEVLGYGSAMNDLSGSQLQASKPVQVLGGSPCIANPTGASACDHVEETVMPAETLGTDYVVTVPTGPKGAPVGHTVRLVGNVDGTTLTFNPAIGGAPGTLDAGQVVQLDNVAQDFEVSGNHEFAVQSMMLSAAEVDPGTAAPNQQGDPSLSTATALQQYRLKYVFLAPDDYPTSFVDIVVSPGTGLTLDGAAVTQTATQVGTTPWGVIRVPLTAGTSGGAHVLTATLPVGIQVLGYGSYTSYQYPGGLNLSLIAPPPPPIM
jgi:IgGFc binding protein